jgi:hypothetical protein
LCVSWCCYPQLWKEWVRYYGPVKSWRK